jgi:tetratricopeptide (TPR) repeat protein
LSLILTCLTVESRGSAPVDNEPSKIKAKSKSVVVLESGDAELFASAEVEKEVEKTKAVTEALQDPKLPPPQRELADKALQESTARVNALADKFPQSPKVQNSAARQSLQSGDVATGILRAEKAEKLARAKKDPELLADALTTRSLGAWYSGDYARATRDANQVLQVRPDDAVAMSIKKLSEGRTQALGAGIKGSAANEQLKGQLDELLTLSSLMKQPEIKIAGGRAANRQEANKKLEDVMRHIQINDAVGALQKADEVLRIDPAIPDIYMQRALAWTMMNDKGRSIEELNKAIALWTAIPRKDGDKRPLSSAHTMRAGALLEKGRAQPAFADADKAVALNPNSAAAHFQRARSREALKQQADAILADFKRAAEIDPKSYQDAYEKAAARLSGGQTGDEDTADPEPRSMPFGPTAAGFLAAAWIMFMLLKKRRSNLDTGVRELAGRELAQGAQVGHFRIEKLLGKGGMGEVWKAWDASLGRWVALKRLSLDAAGDEHLKDLLAREAQSLAKLKHPAICAIHSIFKFEGDLYLVFENVEGVALVDIVEEKGLLSPSDVLALAKPLTAALDYAHAAGVIHRDIKPSNIMLESGQPKLLDFGIARVTANPAGKTVTAVFSGTPSFSPPEADYGVVAKQGDLYSLAVTLYYMMSARLPFEGEGARQDKLDGKPVPLSMYNPDVKSLDEFFKKALAPRPEERFQSGAELWTAFSRALAA